jgi:hypothetical protein
VSTVEITRSRAVRRAILNTPAGALVDVLPGHQGQQIRRLGRRAAQHLAVQHTQRGQRVGDQLIDQGLAGGRVVPVARRLARRGVVIVAAQHRPDLRRQRAAGASCSPTCVRPPAGARRAVSPGSP